MVVEKESQSEFPYQNKNLPGIFVDPPINKGQAIDQMKRQRKKCGVSIKNSIERKAGFPGLSLNRYGEARWDLR